MDREILLYVHSMNNLRQNFVRSRLDPLGITPGQPAILLYLSENDGSIQKEIAKNVNVRAASVVSVLDGLERGGWVERRADVHDRRAWRIYLTDSGRDICYVIRSLFIELDALCLEGFDEHDREVLHVLLQRMVGNLHEHATDSEVNSTANLHI